MNRTLIAATALLLATSAAVSAGEVRITLRGSRASMERQNRIALAEDFSFLRTNRDVARFADEGRLVPVPGGPDYQVIADWPYARPVVKDFVEVLARDYRAGCGEPLVVTSLTRPVTRQPANASPLSVHPAGMAVDLRVSGRRRCVRWLEAELLRLEREGLVDGTREYHPPHFHVAVFPEAFGAFLARRAADSALVARTEADRIAAQLEHELRLAEVAAALARAEASPPPGPSAPLALLGDVLAVVALLLLRV